MQSSHYQKFNEHFIQCFLKDWKGLSRDERDTLQERKYLLNQKFVFSEFGVTKLRILNLSLQREELKIREQAGIIRRAQQKWLKKKRIDNYDWNVLISCWNNDFYKQWHEEFEGNPFFRDDYLPHFSEHERELFYTDNWNKNSNTHDHPLAADFHCYTFRYLYDHTPLAWEDILCIDEVRIEIEIKNQYFIKLKP